MPEPVTQRRVMPSTLLKKWVEQFQKQYQNHQNTVCQIVILVKILI